MIDQQRVGNFWILPGKFPFHFIHLFISFPLYYYYYANFSFFDFRFYHCFVNSCT